MSGAMERLQELVDELGARLGRPVLIDDDELRPLAYSRQAAVDEVRTASILERGAPRAARETLLAQGIAAARRPLHVAGDPALGMAPRICVPLRAGRHRWGYLWIIEDRPLSGEELAAVEQVAHRAASELEEEAGERAADRVRDAGLLADLATGRRPVADVEADLRRHRLLAGRPLGACVVASGGATGGDDAVERAGDGEAERAALRDGLTRLRRRMPAGALLDGEVEGVLTCVAVVRPAVLASLGAASLAAAVHDAIVAEGAAARVGLGSPIAELADAPAAIRRARIALRATHAGALTVDWTALGADRLVGLLPRGLVLDDLPAGVARLLEPEHAVLRQTLEAYLARVGDVKATAEALSLHRAGLYYRLERIEELTGIDLRSGDGRLLCQLALRAARLDGEHGEQP